MVADSDEDDTITAVDVDAPHAPRKKRKTIDELIAASSIGDGLDDIKARGIDAHVADIETAPKKKRKKPAPLTSFALKELKKRGWNAQVVERWIPAVKRKVDLFGVIDIVAIKPGHAIIGIQVTGSTASSGHVQNRRAKILAEPRAKDWVHAGGQLELWGYQKINGRWRLTIETYAEMEAAAR